MNALTPLLPALQTLTPLGLPASFREWHAYANAQQAERLAHHLAAEFAFVAAGYADAVDHSYLRSDGFRANVVQALRAAEIAESEGKLRLIARALAGCLLRYPPPAVDKFQTLRLLEQLSERELNVLDGLLAALDPFDPYSDCAAQPTLPGLSRQETEAALLGLGQLGLLTRLQGGWQLTGLARQVVLLIRLGRQGDLF
ncbi:hypothetical protein [Deinococcus sp.]|uniref:hypothetical protein n=1 Tax=Deinococcus sp. TaxID=47478 RepID=UPI0025BBEDE4|nr:hypothetical protein [Deinococcus sp.]